MATVSMRDMLQGLGVHFGHQTRYWKPENEAVHLRCA
ncbi:30S ribosomal protein S2 [Escherichia coli]|uniref:30S ribosomal protein S2 n=1 Tax=Escherichia coli TaxID=562 RepID=A0A376L1P5_ECOLX|nr:30S ribosomal protein S2 [Escherichia coli]